MSHTDVLKDSLKIYIYLLDAHRADKELIVRDQQGKRSVPGILFIASRE
jgi:hypothetical protein